MCTYTCPFTKQCYLRILFVLILSSMFLSKHYLSNAPGSQEAILIMKIIIFQTVTSCSLVKVYCYFTVTFCSHSLIIKTNKCTNMYCIILKHTLKHLKSSYVVHKHDMLPHHLNEVFY
jgi:hypothetical protein